MIEIADLTYSYPASTKAALQSISLSMEGGESSLVIGRSGSGKSTLLRVINGLVPHFFGGTVRGKAIIASLNTREATPLQLAGKVGTVFQEPGNRFLTTNVLDEIVFGMELVGMKGEEIQRRLDEILHRFELEPLLERRLDQLSAGEQQRVAIAAVMGRSPQVLLLDEPTSQLDAVAGDALLRWLEESRERDGLTTVIAEHRIERLVQWVDRVLSLSIGGGVHAWGSPGAVSPKLAYPPIMLRAEEMLRKAGLNGEIWHRLDRLLADDRIIPREGESREGGGRALRGANLSFQYNGIPALVEASIDVYPGEIVALVGRNGSGKSTLLRCLMGLLQPERGEVWLEGKRIDGKPVADLAKTIGYIPQWPSALLFSDSVIEELNFTLQNHGLEKNPPIPPVELLRQLDLLDVRERYPRDLSAGQKQRVAIAAVLVSQPDFVLLDEPTLGMDPLAVEGLSDLLAGLRSKARGILIATHDVEFAAAIADRVVILENGSVAASGPAAETIFSRPELRTRIQQALSRPYPASLRDLHEFMRKLGVAHADN
jgi:energy-coupling factor transport system ATP-binding protein